MAVQQHTNVMDLKDYWTHHPTFYSTSAKKKKPKTQGLKYSVYKRHKPKFTVKPKVAIYSFLIVEG